MCIRDRHNMGNSQVVSVWHGCDRFVSETFSASSRIVLLHVIFARPSLWEPCGLSRDVGPSQLYFLLSGFFFSTSFWLVRLQNLCRWSGLARGRTTFWVHKYLVFPGGSFSEFPGYTPIRQKDIFGAGAEDMSFSLTGTYYSLDF